MTIYLRFLSTGVLCIMKVVSLVIVDFFNRKRRVVCTKDGRQ